MKYMRSMTILAVLSLFVAIPLALGQDESINRPGGMIIEHTYYSDYFDTVVGWDVSDNCDPFNPYFDSMGTTDGAYMIATWFKCPGGGGGVRCYEKVNGEWWLITCPQ